MAADRPGWLRVVGWSLTWLLATASMGYSQFTPFSDHTSALLEGNWQSCREADGQYSERIYDSKLPGFGPFELHMGPYHEFALFRGVQDAHRDHNSAENLLKPFTVEVANNTARQKWVAGGLLLDVRLAGGSRDECESWFVTLTPLGTSSSSR